MNESIWSAAEGIIIKEEVVFSLLPAGSYTPNHNLSQSWWKSKETISFKDRLYSNLQAEVALLPGRVLLQNAECKMSKWNKEKKIYHEISHQVSENYRESLRSWIFRWLAKIQLAEVGWSSIPPYSYIFSLLHSSIVSILTKTCFLNFLYYSLPFKWVDD